MRQFQKIVDQPQLPQNYQRRRMHGVAAKIAQKIRMPFQNDGLYPGSPEQVTEHNAGGAAPRNTTLNVQRFWHKTSNIRGQPGKLKFGGFSHPMVFAAAPY